MHTCILLHGFKRSWHSCPEWVNGNNKNTPSMHHPQRRNVTTSMVGLRNGQYTKISKNGEPQRYSWEHRRRRRAPSLVYKFYLSTYNWLRWPMPVIHVGRWSWMLIGFKVTNKQISTEHSSTSLQHGSPWCWTGSKRTIEHCLCNIQLSVH